MASMETMKVVQVGASGVVAETFRDVIARSDMPFELEAVATASHPELHGKKLGETHLGGRHRSLDDTPIIGLVSAIENTDAPLVFSGLQAKMAARYEDRLAAGRLVVTNASANRTRPDVPVVSAFTNAEQIDELFKGDSEGKIIAGGNCTSAIISVPLAPIDREIGIHSMSVKTSQGWSGAGATTVPKDVGDHYEPITGDEQDKIQTEINEFLSPAINAPNDILIGATTRRAPWVRGHHAEVALILERETTKQEVEDLLRHFEAPEELRAVRSQLRAISLAGGDKWPKRHQPIKPVKLEHGSLVRTDTPTPRLDRIQPMRVRAHVVEFNPEDPTRIVIEVAGDNLMQGAVGGNMLNAIYARVRGYI